MHRLPCHEDTMSQFASYSPHFNQTYQPFESRPEALGYLAQILSGANGRSLVITTSKVSLTEVLGLSGVVGRPIQSAERVPSQQERQATTVASYRTVIDAAGAEYGAHRIDASTVKLVVYDNPHKLSPVNIRELQAVIGATQHSIAITAGASFASERYMREVFSIEPQSPASPCFVRPVKYNPRQWYGDRVAKLSLRTAGCKGDGFDERFRGRGTEAWDAIRTTHCPSCPAADTCLAAGLEFDQRQAGHRNRFWGAWGGLSEGARRVLRAALRHDATPAEAAFLVERARG